ncbi:MAG: crotonase/enoyl-CoA hydratase family protein [Raineya sp.]
MNAFQSIQIQQEGHLAHIKLNRPEKANAMDSHFWQELPQALAMLEQQAEVRAIILYGEGKNFSSGIDLAMLMQVKQDIANLEAGRAAEKVYKFVLSLQESINAVEKCSKPVIAAIHGACIGGGVDLICACDMRFASEEAYFCVKEVDMGIIADLGTLQRLPKIIPAGIAAELAFTARKMPAQEAKSLGLVNNVWETKEILLEEVNKIAQHIAEKSPLVIRGIKKTLLHSRDHSVAQGLDFIANWNASQLMSQDVEIAIMAQMQKQKPIFND